MKEPFIVKYWKQFCKSCFLFIFQTNLKLELMVWRCLEHYQGNQQKKLETKKLIPGNYYNLLLIYFFYSLHFNCFFIKLFNILFYRVWKQFFVVLKNDELVFYNNEKEARSVSAFITIIHTNNVPNTYFQWCKACFISILLIFFILRLDKKFKFW